MERRKEEEKRDTRESVARAERSPQRKAEVSGELTARGPMAMAQVTSRALVSSPLVSFRCRRIEWSGGPRLDSIAPLIDPCFY